MWTSDFQGELFNEAYKSHKADQADGNYTHIATWCLLTTATFCVFEQEIAANSIEIQKNEELDKVGMDFHQPLSWLILLDQQKKNKLMPRQSYHVSTKQEMIGNVFKFFVPRTCTSQVH